MFHDRSLDTADRIKREFRVAVRGVAGVGKTALLDGDDAGLAAIAAAGQEPFDGPDGFDGRRQPVDWKTAEDNRLRARYAEVQQQLASERDASLDATVDALELRPDLVARLIGR